MKDFGGAEMRKKLSILLLGLVFVFSLGVLIQPLNSYAKSTEDMDYEEIENIGKNVQKYIIVDGDRLFFDYQKAKENNESQDLIEQGLLLESVSDSYSKTDNETTTLRAVSLPIWGNYCGPGYGGKDSNKPATDVLDEGCRRHDQCYKWSLTLRKNCKCNKDLVNYIDNHKSEMSGTMAKVAWAIRTYFNTEGQLGC